jgi:hypothetical protein
MEENQTYQLQHGTAFNEPVFFVIKYWGGEEF